jgi:hypothetical protein
MPSSLVELQRRFHDAVVGDAVPDDALDVVRDDGVSQRRRLEVYANAYRIRIVEAIAAEFPKVAAALGPARHAELCRRHLAAHPTSRPSLRDAAQHLARFLDGGGLLDAPSWLADLARLERARTEAFDGAEARALVRDDLASFPPEEIAFLQLPLVPTAQLVTLHSISDEVWTALENERPIPDEPAAPVAPRGVLVWRRQVTVYHRTLASDEAEVLRALGRGATFGEACELLVDHEEPAQRALQIILTALDGAAFDGERARTAMELAASPDEGAPADEP